jgi:flagellar basal-body rod protein FlgC
LRASLAQFTAAASNVATMNDVAAVPAGLQAQPAGAPPPYQPVVAVLQSASGAGGPAGVAASYASAVPAYGIAYDPSSPSADDKGEVAVPNVDLAEQMVKISMAVQAFRANVAVMNAGNRLAKSALDILS